MPLGSDRDYAAFLKAQYVARSAIEAAFVAQPPFGMSAPPPQSKLLAADIADLGMSLPHVEATAKFRTAEQSLGACWVVAGSSLGNRTLLSRRTKAGLHGPTRFLSDRQLASHFGALLKVLEQPFAEYQVNAAIQGAIATFALFEAAFCNETVKVAA